MKIQFLIPIALGLLGLTSHAHDFSVTLNGQRLYFNILDNEKKTTFVTYGGKFSDTDKNTLKGEINIPDKIKYNDLVYTVTGIGQKAFANAKELKEITIPATVSRIDDFAFENCDSLRIINFPENPVRFGEGVFFNCNQIEKVSIGKNWTEINFTMFRWSKNLKSVFIPENLKKIRGLKMLKYLKYIEVDSSNNSYDSYKGMLYSKNGKILYACPRAYEDTLWVREGTEKVLEGALIDCRLITTLILPSTLQNISFRETSEMKDLKEIIIHKEQPLITGYLDETGYFFFQLADPKVMIFVPQKSKKDYIKSLAKEAGEYKETIDGVPYRVTTIELPLKKNIKGVKNFKNFYL